MQCLEEEATSVNFRVIRCGFPHYPLRILDPVTFQVVVASCTRLPNHVNYPIFIVRKTPTLQFSSKISLRGGKKLPMLRTFGVPTWLTLQASAIRKCEHQIIIDIKRLVRNQSSGAMGSIKETERTYPLIKPKGHKPPVPRWSLKLPNRVAHISTLYIGVQCHRENEIARRKAEDFIDSILNNEEAGSPPIDTFRVTNGFDLPGSRVWVAYWMHSDGFVNVLKKLNLERLWNDLGTEKNDIGIWQEHFVAPVERLETNYARLDHKPGLAQLPDTTQPSHELTAYWGAGRDRIPASGDDRFETPKNASIPTNPPGGLGERLTGTNYNNSTYS